MKSAVIVIVVLLLGCMAATEQAEAKAQGPDTLYRTKCTACHRVYPPQEHAYRIFEEHVSKYGKGLSDEERQRLLEYLKENAKHESVEGGVMVNRQDGSEKGVI